ncbi:DUF4345 domain-containing protein [Alkalimarinus coralli]|uniref:DUF4345 domain-containing protein n=1 Tax=Alkalimarinus coralli TaxID=2935863 RepID=UPI00202B1C5E|nr:DUF4345 domain-containing protein [Alkalimarinus coralli]
MESTLKYMLYAISLVALGTGLNVMIGGASAIPGASGEVEATVDNELRFFAVFWIAYGAFGAWIARNIRTQYIFIPFIALVFFLGGVGRLLSTLLVGAPADILIPAMVLEFVVPIVLYLIYRRLFKTSDTLQPDCP